MLLDRYDFYDIYASIVAIRSKPKAVYNIGVINSIKDAISKKQESNCMDTNIIRNALKTVENIDKDLFYWAYIQNAYTYGHRIEKDEFYYNFLLNAFNLLSFCAENKEYDRLGELADALHNIPHFIADGCKNFRKSAKRQFSFYDKKYKTDLWKEITK